MAQELGTVLKHKVAFYLNIGTKVAPVWARLGKGFTELSGSLNPQTETTQYIDESVSTNETTSYQPEYSGTAERYNGDPANDFLYKGALNQALGRQTEMCRVDLTDPAADGTFPAKKGLYNLNYSEFDTGAAGEKTGYSVGFAQVDALIDGSFDIEALEFTEA